MNIRIRDYKPEYQIYFENLNKQWIEEYFVLEDIDKWVLEHPDEAILKDGGHILFAEADGNIVGTVALKFVSDGIYELTKMAVAKHYRGAGAGKILCRAAIRQAESIGASNVILYSQTSLAAAIGIYRTLGFVEVPLEPGKYRRANIKMELNLAAK